MKHSSKWILILLGIGLIAVIAWIGLSIAPGADHALRISQLMEPLIQAENKAMRLSVSASVNSDSMTLDSNIYLVTEGETSYFVLEQDENVVYVTDNLLLLGNGKAFKLGDKLQTQTASCKDLLSQILSLYLGLEIKSDEQTDSVIYDIAVGEDQANSLLSALSLGSGVSFEAMEKLNLRLAEKDGILEEITFSGKGKVDGNEIRLDGVLSDFQLLAPGDYPIPEAVTESAFTVDPENLFSLTEDLYRLVLALVPIAEGETLSGILVLRADCGLIQLDTQLNLSELKTSVPGEIDPEQLHALPEILSLMCMEGDIRCTQRGNSYVYTLELDRQAMQQLSQMILPELSQYSDQLTEGNLTILLEAGKIATMEVSITGKLNARIAQIPITVSAEFIFN